jgi:hypothetical protein
MAIALAGGLLARREPLGAFAFFLKIADGSLLRLRVSGGKKKEQTGSRWIS